MIWKTLDMTLNLGLAFLIILPIEVEFLTVCADPDLFLYCKIRVNENLFIVVFYPVFLSKGIVNVSS